MPASAEGFSSNIFHMFTLSKPLRYSSYSKRFAERNRVR